MIGDLFSGVLHGYIKMPKGGKVRKGWTQKFAVVKDYQLYLFEREKDVESLPGTPLADIRQDIFYVRTITQDELIHASAKEIDCIFKIQVIRIQLTNDKQEVSYDYRVGVY